MEVFDEDERKLTGFLQDRTLEHGLVNGLVPVQCLGVISKLISFHIQFWILGF